MPHTTKEVAHFMSKRRKKMKKMHDNVKLTQTKVNGKLNKIKKEIKFPNGQRNAINSNEILINSIFALVALHFLKQQKKLHCAA